MTLKQSTAFTVKFYMVQDATGANPHIGGKTGLGSAVTVQLSKGPQSGTGVGSFAAGAGTVQEIGLGWYQYAGTTADSGTLGNLAFDCTATGADATDFKEQVDPQIFTDLNLDAATGRVKILNNLQQNTALNGWTFPMTNSATGIRQTGLTVTAQRTLGGGGFAPCTNSPTEITGTGIYTLNLTAGDVNSATVGILLTATGANDLYVPLVPTP